MEPLFFRFNAGRIPILIIAVLALSACSIIGRDDAGETTAVEGVNVFGDLTTLVNGPAFLMCTQECRDRGFCGMLPEGGRVILMSTLGPATQNFNFFALDTTAVNVTGSQTQNAVLRIDQVTPLSVNFYAVTTAENQQAWVAGYCVGQQQPLPQ